MSFEYLMLLPFGEGEQCLHSLKVVKDQELVVGRNRSTFQEGKSHPYFLIVSRRHVKILWKGGSEVLITGLNSTTPNCVSLNDSVVGCGEEVIAKEGDHICLIHEKKCFNYKLMGIQTRSTATAPAEQQLPGHVQTTSTNDDKEDEISAGKCDHSNTSPVTNRSGTNEALVSKTECAICLLPLAFAHAVHPCGHHFCYVCIYDWTKANTTCPSCQATIAGMNPSHVLNDIIEGVLSNYEDKSILEEWKERLSEGVAAKKKNSADGGAAHVPAVTTTSAAASSSSSAPPAVTSTCPPNILSALGASRKRPHASISSSAAVESSAVIDLTEHGRVSSGNTNAYETPARSDAVPQRCIAFHIRPDYRDIKTAEVGMAFKQILDNFDTNSSGLSNACWNPNRRCKHCRHLIAVDSFVVSSVGPPCFQKLFHVQCLSSYNRGLHFMGGSAMDRAVTFEKVVNTANLGATEVTQLRYNTVL